MARTVMLVNRSFKCGLSVFCDDQRLPYKSGSRFDLEVLQINRQWMKALFWEYRFSSSWVQSHVWLFVTPWTAAHQTSLSIINSWSLLKLMSIESVMPSNHLILCHPGGLPWMLPSLGSQSLLSFGLIAHHSALSVCLHLRMHVLSWLNSGAGSPRLNLGSAICYLHDLERLI